MSTTEQIGYRQPLTYSGFDFSLPCELDWIPFFAPKIGVSTFIYGLRHCNFFCKNDLKVLHASALRLPGI